jgi:hypothetical protein
MDYYKYLGGWKKDSEHAKEVYEMVDSIPDETFNCGKDWVRGYKRDLSHLLIERVVSPYNFYRDLCRKYDALLDEVALLREDKK